MTKIQVITVGVFREIMEESKFNLELDDDLHPDPTVDTVIDILDRKYHGRIRKEVYLEDGERNQWIRILLNGRDTRFLPEESLTVKNGDTVMLSSVLVGG